MFVRAIQEIFRQILKHATQECLQCFSVIDHNEHPVIHRIKLNGEISCRSLFCAYRKPMKPHNVVRCSVRRNRHDIFRPHQIYPRHIILFCLSPINAKVHPPLLSSEWKLYDKKKQQSPQYIGLNYARRSIHLPHRHADDNGAGGHAPCVATDSAPTMLPRPTVTPARMMRPRQSRCALNPNRLHRNASRTIREIANLCFLTHQGIF